MKTYRSKSGPFLEKPYYRPEEVESICVDELQKISLLPTEPAPIRIDRFVEKRFDLQVTYDDLPTGILGFTRFGSNGVEEIVVSKVLDDEDRERQLRTTLAHEGGHGLLHAHLFVLSQRPDALFGDGLGSDAPKILCRKEAVPGTGVEPIRKPPYQWHEYQANLAMSSLLLPRVLVAKALESVVLRRGLINEPVLPPDRREEAAKLLSNTFNVNKIVATIRLEAVYPSSADRQLTL